MREVRNGSSPRFRITAAQRGALDVEARPQHDILAALPAFLADHRA